MAYLPSINISSVVAHHLWHERTDCQKAAVLLLGCAIIFSLASLAVLPTGSDLLRFKQFANWCHSDPLNAGIILSTAPLALGAMVGSWFYHASKSNLKSAADQLYENYWKDRTTEQRAFFIAMVALVIATGILGFTHYPDVVWKTFANIGPCTIYGLSLLGVALFAALGIYNSTAEISIKAQQKREFERGKKQCDVLGISCQAIDNFPEVAFDGVYDFQGAFLKVGSSFDEVLDAAKMLRRMPDSSPLPKFVGIVYVANAQRWGFCYEKVEGEKLSNADLSLQDICTGMLDLISTFRDLECIDAHISKQNILITDKGWRLSHPGQFKTCIENSIKDFRKLFYEIYKLTNSFQSDGYEILWILDSKHTNFKAFKDQLSSDFLNVMFIKPNPTWDELTSVLAEYAGSEVRVENYRKRLEAVDIAFETVTLEERHKMLGGGTFGEVFDYNGRALKIYSDQLGTKVPFHEILMIAEMMKKASQISLLPKFYGVAYVSKGDEKRFGILMEKIEGERLEVRLGRRLRNPDISSLPYYCKQLLDIVEPLRQLDEMGYSHADVMPRNIIINSKGKWILIDYDKKFILKINSIRSVRLLFFTLFGFSMDDFQGEFFSKIKFIYKNRLPEEREPLEALVKALPQDLMDAFEGSDWRRLTQVLTQIANPTKKSGE